jgi:hypothetical protein
MTRENSVAHFPPSCMRLFAAFSRSSSGQLDLHSKSASRDSCYPVKRRSRFSSPVDGHLSRGQRLEMPMSLLQYTESNSSNTAIR